MVPEIRSFSIWPTPSNENVVDFARKDMMRAFNAVWHIRLCLDISTVAWRVMCTEVWWRRQTARSNFLFEFFARTMCELNEILCCFELRHFSRRMHVGKMCWRFLGNGNRIELTIRCLGNTNPSQNIHEYEFDRHDIYPSLSCIRISILSLIFWSAKDALRIMRILRMLKEKCTKSIQVAAGYRCTGNRFPLMQHIGCICGNKWRKRKKKKKIPTVPYGLLISNAYCFLTGNCRSLPSMSSPFFHYFISITCRTSGNYT